MRKVIGKIINIILVFSMFFSSVISVQAADISDDASKGDLRLGNYKRANKDKVSVSKTDANGVTVKKEVTKTSAGNYGVEFFVSGPTTTVTTQIQIPVYVVFVIDRSYSMRQDNRWTNATKAAVDISERFHLLGVNMAVVGFSGGRNRSEANGGDTIAYNDTVDIRGNFSAASIAQSVFDKWGYDTNHNTGGGTNMQAGLKRAQELLKGKNGLKHIILLSDGVPTFYYDENGYSKGAGNSNTDSRIEQVPAVVAKTKEAATAIKKSGITIHTIGYHFDKLTYVHSSDKTLNERALAEDTLSNVASSSSNYHVVNSNQETNLSIEFNNIKTDISTVSIANNPVITDGIGNSFKLSGSDTYGGSKTLSKTNFGVTIKPTSIGKFSIQINPNSKTGWYPTNKDFTLSYTHATKGTQTIKITENPEVFWSQPAPYTIYHVERGNESNVLGIDIGTKEYNANVPVNQKTFTGYTYHSKSKNAIKIDTTNNIAYVYYDRNLYDYTIQHLEFENEVNILGSNNGTAIYQTIISVPNREDEFEGFSYYSQDKDEIVIETGDNTATVYYKRNKYSYTVEHYKETLDGEFKLVLEDVKVYEDVPFASETTYEVNEYAGYTYDATKTENAGSLVPANNDLVIRLYYTLDESAAKIYYVVKEGNNYYPFSEFGILEDNLLSFENVNLNDVLINGKYGMPFATEYRLVPGYYLEGLYAGNILDAQNLVRLEETSTTDTLGVELKEYTYVYEVMMGEGDSEEDVILPPQTGYEASINPMEILLFVCAAYIMLNSKKIKVND